MKVKVRLFGMLSEAATVNSIAMADVDNTDEVLRQLFIKFPSLEQMQYTISVNHTIYSEKVDLTDGDEIAMLPPFAGG